MTVRRLPVRRLWPAAGLAPERGQAVVELALIFPLLALMVCLILDFGRVFTTSAAVANAAREGARYCALHPGDTSGTRTRVQNELNAQIATADIDTAGTTCPSTAAGQPVTVSVRVRFTPITPVVSNVTGTTVWLPASATMVVW